MALKNTRIGADSWSHSRGCHSGDVEVWSTVTQLLNHNDDEGNENEGEAWKTKAKAKLKELKSQTEVIDTDGSVYRSDRDAPGQCCVYIPPGNHNEELYRLATFSWYPKNVPVKVADMARIGFHFTGFRDRVKCFSCGITVENWIVGDDALDPKWHLSDCKMPRGGDPRNIPIRSLNFRALKYLGNAALPQTSSATNAQEQMDVVDVTSNLRRFQIDDTHLTISLANIVVPEHEVFLKSLNLRKESDRRSTFSKWPSYPAPYLPSELAKDGFFYLGNMDRAQCFCCGGVLRNWAPDDVVREQHKKHFPQCRLMSNLDSGNVPMTEQQRREAVETDRARLSELLPSEQTAEPPDPSPEEQRHLAQYFPCRDPVNPHMRSHQHRADSFDQRWPRNRISATPDQIAKAGFFYLGQGDKTKCFYCNGGLQNWEPNDEPWTEHAKWFPGCEFVLRHKGADFVRRIFEAHPNLNRPNIRNPVSYDIPPVSPHRRSPEPSTGERGGLDIDVDHIKTMGFSEELIKRSLERLRSRGLATTESVIQDILEHQENNQGRDVGQTLAANAVKRPSVDDNGIESKKTKPSSESGNSGEISEAAESLKRIQEETLCKKCRKDKAEVMVTPCGHLSLCLACAPNIKRCVICKSKVQNTMRIFRA